MAKYPPGVYLRGETFWIKFYAKGKMYRTPAKTTKVTEAKKLRAGCKFSRVPTRLTWAIVEVKSGSRV